MKMTRVMALSYPDLDYSDRGGSRKLPNICTAKPVNPMCFLDTAAYHALQPILLPMRLSGIVFVKDFNSCPDQPRKRPAWRGIAEQTYSSILLFIYAFSIAKCFPTFNSADTFGAPLFIKIMVTVWYMWCGLNALAFYMASYRYRALPEYILEWNDIRGGNPYCRRKSTLCVAIATVLIIINMIFSVYVVMVNGMFDAIILYPFDEHSEYALIMRILTILVYIFYQCCWMLPVVITFGMCAALFYEFRLVNMRLDEYIRERSEDAEKLMDIRLAHQKICRLVGHADDVLKLHTAISLIASVIATCLTLYVLLIDWPNMNSFIVPTMFIFWLISSLAFMGIICVGGAYVNEEAHAAFEMIHDMPLTSTDPNFTLQLNIFISRLSGSPVGLTAFNMFVIDKPTTLTMIGMLITYFVLLIQFKPSSSEVCNCAEILANITDICS